LNILRHIDRNQHQIKHLAHYSERKEEEELNSFVLRLELLNLARCVAVVALLPAVGVGARHEVVAEFHGPRSAPASTSAVVWFERVQSGEGIEGWLLQ
jgi:hypothetical protein